MFVGVSKIRDVLIELAYVSSMDLILVSVRGIRSLTTSLHCCGGSAVIVRFLHFSLPANVDRGQNH